MARKISMIDLAGIGNLLEYLVAADNITCEERDRIILRIAKENDIAEYILRVAKFGGILTTVITVAADVLGYCSNFPDLYKGAIESSGLWAGILTGIFEKRVGNINNPYTYLAQIKSTFSYYPGASKLFGGQPQIAKYNYTLYRGFEEFIND